MTLTRSVSQDAFSTTVGADFSMLAVNPDPFTWTLDVESTFRIRTQLDLGVVHLAAGTVGQVDLTAGFWIQAATGIAPTSCAPTATSNTWDTRHCVRNATKAISYHLGVGFFDYPAVALAAGDWEMWIGIGVEDDLDLSGVTVTGYTPSGSIDIFGYEVNF